MYRRDGYLVPHLLPIVPIRVAGGVLIGMLLVGGRSEGVRDGRDASSVNTAAAPDLQGALALAQVQLQRANAIMEFSARYDLAADLAAAIHDIALAEGLDPALAFALVKVESNFNAAVVSRAGAIGYTQILPSTARLYEPGLTIAQLHGRDTNLRLGFRYLHDLLGRFDGTPDTQLRLALLAYNRGPARVQELLDAGRNPHNGYATTVLRGYHGVSP